MLSFQEMVDKLKPQLDLIEATMDSWGKFHPNMETPEHTRCSVFAVEDEALRYELQETFKRTPLKEFLAKSGSTGIAGAAYLIPDALHTKLITASHETDKVPLFAAQVVDGWNGGDLLVDIVVRQTLTTTNTADGGKWTMRPKRFTSGARMPVQTWKTTQATLSPKGFSVHLQIGQDLIEDAQAFDLVEFYTRQAAHQLGQYATDLALADLKAASDGDGTQAAVTAGADTTTTANLLEGIREVGAEFWHPNTLIVTYEAWADAIVSTATAANLNVGAPAAGYDLKFDVLDVVFNNSSELHAGTSSGKMTDCVTLVLDRNAALLCGRKRWMQIENYAHPVNDLSGAVISCRQDCVTLYKDACCKISES